MKLAPFLSLVALSRAPAVLAQSTDTSAEPATTTTSSSSSCTASLITKLCDYIEPGPEFAVAIESKESCWEYCDSNPPCNFVIFAAGNPYLGSGTCWVYPGEQFDESQGNSDCGNPYLSVYDQPVCDGGSPTATGPGACAATASPSAVAEVCGYPAPEDCFYDCVVSEGASQCLSQCAEADSCSYAVFNPNNESNSPYASGNCWIFADGEYDAGLTTDCGGAPEQYVYDNTCPRPSPSSTAPTSSSATADPSGSETSEPDPNSDASSQGSGNGDDSEDLAAIGISRNNLLAIGMAVLIL